jgi:hypothetical protein
MEQVLVEGSNHEIGREFIKQVDGTCLLCRVTKFYYKLQYYC